ncbi:type 2 isopentenyl-diphosphate Delta-isomerase [Bacteroidota bacterium]
MSGDKNETIRRKKDHINLCINDDVGFKKKTAGFENYSFEHYAITELNLNEIDLSTTFLGKKVSFPFLISCMTGGTEEAKNLNADLAVAAKMLNIPIGVGSQRQALESKEHHKTYKVVRENAPNVPILGNIGAAQIVSLSDCVGSVETLVQHIEADAMVIHVNPLQELLQKEGEPNFKGLLKAIEKLTRELTVPIIVKEVGSGIGKKAAKRLLDVGVKGIDVAGAGGTSWAGVELLRNKIESDIFWDWGIQTARCIEDVSLLADDYDFSLIASGGITSGIEIAKSIALGADLAASARPIIKELSQGGIDGVVKLIEDWFDTVKKIMYLTESINLVELNRSKLLNY